MKQTLNNREKALCTFKAKVLVCLCLTAAILVAAPLSVLGIRAGFQGNNAAGGFGLAMAALAIILLYLAIEQNIITKWVVASYLLKRDGYYID